MAKKYKLAAEKRQAHKHSARETRALNRVPAIVYGHGGDPKPVSVDYSDFLRTFRTAGQAALIDLDIDGESTKVVIQSYDLDPVQNTFTHADFFAINPKQAMIVHVPLNFVGESEAIKNEAGILNRSHDALDIRCLPADIPHDIEVDISLITEIGGHITIAQLNLPENLELMHYEVDETLCTVTAPRMPSEEDDAAADAAAAEAEEGEEGAEAGEESKEGEEGGDTDSGEESS